MIAIEALRDRYVAERPVYEQLANHVRELLESRLRRLGLAYSMDARAKDVSSFIKKVMRKVNTHESPYDDIHDKAGVRIVVTYAESVHEVRRAIEELFPGSVCEDKQLNLPYDRLGYLGVHFEVTLTDGLLDAGREDFHGKICEIQLHTRAQNVWAGISHELLYKPSQAPPPDVRRAIYRLMALVEIFDNETRGARDVILGQGGFQEARMLDQLERQYYRLAGRPYDHELSLEVLAHLIPSLSTDEISGFGALMDDFVASNSVKLGEIFERYAHDDRCSPLLFQPESLLVFERFQNAPFILEDIWQQAMPSEWLESLTSIWGVKL